MKKRAVTVILSTCMASALLVGCGSSATTAEKTAEETSVAAETTVASEVVSTETTTELVESTSDTNYADMKIVLILPGSIDDQGWNASNNAGATVANEKLGSNIEVVESVPTEEFEATFTEYGEKGYNLVLSAGSQFDEACKAVAPNYPDTVYSVINGTECESDNMVPVFPKEYEGAYLAGVMAGYATGNGQFATMGGESNAAMVKLLDVYEAIAIQTAEENGVSGAAATRSFLNTWTDVAVTKSMTEQMMDNGADTVFCYSNEGTSGAIQGTEEKGGKFIGFAGNKNDESSCVYGSINMNWSNVYPWIVEGVASGELKGAQEVGIAEGVFEVLYTDQCTDDCKTAVDAAYEEVSSGSVDFTQYFSEN